MDRKELEILLNLGDTYNIGKQEAEKIEELKKQLCTLKQSVAQRYEETRTKKMNQLYQQLEKTQTEITFLETEINNIKTNYCAKHGHQFLHNFYSRRCVLCGNVWKTDRGYNNFSYIEKSIITSDCYTSTEYSEHGLSIEIIENKLIELYEDYAIIIGLMKSLCGIFGHIYKEDTRMNADVCQCCGKMLFYGPGAINIHYTPKTEIIKKGKNYFIKKPQYDKIEGIDKPHYIEISSDQNNNLQQLREFHKYIISSGDLEQDIKLLQEEYSVKQKKKIPTAW